MNNQCNVEELKKRLTGKNPGELLKSLSDIFSSSEIVFATSLGTEDQLITHFIAETGEKVRIITLDTGRLHEETYELLERTRSKYGMKIEVYFPDRKRIEDMVAEKGVNLFYNSIDDRKRCCSVRKLEPLKRALAGAKVWITGLRRGQALTRTHVDLIDADEANRLIKINPLYDWSDQQLWDFIRSNAVLYNSLHDKGFPSIGCAPCTRAIKAGEDIRAGRWWWEGPEHKECGLHKRG